MNIQLGKIGTGGTGGIGVQDLWYYSSLEAPNYILLTNLQKISASVQTQLIKDCIGLLHSENLHVIALVLMVHLIIKVQQHRLAVKWRSQTERDLKSELISPFIDP